jgi:hypothetical protein
MLVTLHVWRVPRRKIGAAFLRMARDPGRLRSLPGVRFAKLLGTSAGETFVPGEADWTRYAAVLVWDGPPVDVDGGWARIAESRARVAMTPLTSRGTWSGRAPFGVPAGGRTDGPVLALTRARLRLSKALTFWNAVPPVTAELHAADGLLARFGMGEAPIGWQGTVTVWRSTADLVGFAYRQPQHRAVIARTPTDNWYAEDLFARFAIREISGDKAVLGWREGGQARR